VAGVVVEAGIPTRLADAGVGAGGAAKLRRSQRPQADAGDIRGAACRGVGVWHWLPGCGVFSSKVFIGAGDAAVVMTGVPVAW
jgi:hypothetical protein